MASAISKLVKRIDGLLKRKWHQPVWKSLSGCGERRNKMNEEITRWNNEGKPIAGRYPGDDRCLDWTYIGSPKTVRTIWNVEYTAISETSYSMSGIIATTRSKVEALYIWNWLNDHKDQFDVNYIWEFSVSSEDVLENTEVHEGFLKWKANDTLANDLLKVIYKWEQEHDE
jgi:hypothetical protein